MSLITNIVTTIEKLPIEKQREILDFAEYLYQKENLPGIEEKSRRKVLGALEHLNINISAEEIDESRREMWKGYVKEDFK